MQSSAFPHLQCIAVLFILRHVPKPKLDNQITFRLSTADKADLITHAEKQRRSHNWLAREIILQWLDKKRPKCK